jgi:hypothetical protein
MHGDVGGCSRQRLGDVFIHRRRRSDWSSSIDRGRRRQLCRGFMFKYGEMTRRAVQWQNKGVRMPLKLMGRREMGRLRIRSARQPTWTGHRYGGFHGSLRFRRGHGSRRRFLVLLLLLKPRWRVFSNSIRVHNITTDPNLVLVAVPAPRIEAACLSVSLTIKDSFSMALTYDVDTAMIG